MPTRSRARRGPKPDVGWRASMTESQRVRDEAKAMSAQARPKRDAGAW